MPKIILSRHGLTDYNAQRRYQGQTDVPLNSTGLAQAEALRKKLANFRLTAAYCSDLSRARVTAEIALRDHPSGLQAIPISDLREASGGLFEGLTWDEMNEKYPEEVKQWQQDRYSCGTPQGENLKQVLERAKTALAQIVKNHPSEEENVLIVAHGGISGVILCHLMGMDVNRLWQWRFDTCSVTIVDIYNDASILSLFNDTTHIEEMEKQTGNPPMWRR